MAAQDDVTTQYGYELPWGGNALSHDVTRIRNALTAIDSDMAAKVDAVDFSATSLLAQLVTVDGDGSGLDADLLDGFHATHFSETTHTHVAATSASAGFLSASDKSKLSGIEAGAQVNAVASVAGHTGAVTLTASDVAGVASSTHTHALSTSASAGFMSAADRTAMDYMMANTIATVVSINGRTGTVVLTYADIGAAADSHSHAVASSAGAGFMSANDKTTLDALATSSVTQGITSVNAKTGVAITLTYSDLGAAASGHTHAAATTAAAGFLAASDKTKLDGIGTGANVQSVNGKTGALTLSATDVSASANTHTHAVATTAAAGFLATTDKSKLDGIAAGAQVNVVTSVAAKTGAVTLSASDIIGLAGTVINARLFFVSGF